MSIDPAFQAAWDYSCNDLSALRMIERGGVWRVMHLDGETGVVTPRLGDLRNYEMIKYRTILLRGTEYKRDHYVIEACWEGKGDWTEVTRGRMER